MSETRKGKIYGTCGSERVYNENHRLKDPCKFCASIESAECYQCNSEKKPEKDKF